MSKKRKSISLTTKNSKFINYCYRKKLGMGLEIIMELNYVKQIMLIVTNPDVKFS